MSAHTERASFLFIMAAWYSLIIPVLSPVIWFAIAEGTGGYLGVAFMWALRILITSFIAGVVSLFGYSRRGRKLVLWIAVIGTVVSFVLGFLSYVYWHMSQTFHG